MDPTNLNDNGAQRCNELWFNDGTVVLQAGNTLFKVYSGLLAAQSSIFRDLFSLPPQIDYETYEGLPLVRLPDSEKDIREFLIVLLRWRYYDTIVNGDGALSMLKLTTKYEVSDLRRLIISKLAEHYPSTLEAREKIYTNPDILCSIYNFHPFEIANAAREANALVLLPAVLYSCACLPLHVLMDGDHRPDDKILHLSPENKRATILARQQLGHIARKETFGFVFDTWNIEGCESEGSCSDQRQAWAEILEGYEDGWVEPLKTVRLQDLDFCDTCRSNAEEWHNEAREVLWRGLPKIFGLSPWIELAQSSDLGNI